jgi:type IV secretory pathway TrbD component
MSTLQMILIASVVFLGDLTAVAAIIASLWLERSLGVSRGVVLDWIIVVAASYGLAAWVVGHVLTRSMARGRTELAEKADVPVLVDCPPK